MHYFTLENTLLRIHIVEQLPADIETLYQQVRQAYTISYTLSDWADDDSDAGMGYDYNNSYSIKREPYRHELVVKDGSLIGFYVGRISPIDAERNNGLLSEKDVDTYLLSLTGKQHIFIDKQPYSSRYGHSECWDLTKETAPGFCKYVFLPYVKQAEKDYTFTPTDFAGDLIEEVVNAYYIEDSRGHFNDAYRIRLKLKPAASKDPDRVLQTLSDYRAVLVRE